MFKELKEEYQISTGSELLDVLSIAKITDYNEYLIFNQGGLLKKFKANIEFLSSPSTIDLSWLNQMLINGFCLIAQTIDGNYLASTNNQTLVIPVTLQKNSIERFDIQVIDWLICYELGSIQSNFI